MIMRILLPTLAATAFGFSAVAAPSPSTNLNPAGTNNTSGMNATPAIGARLRQSLSKAGFSDIHVMPESFLVRAKDSDGNPVMMVVNPDSVTAVTALGTSGTGTSAGNGEHGMNSNSAENSTGAENDKAANQRAANNAEKPNAATTGANNDTNSVGRQQ